MNVFSVPVVAAARENIGEAVVRAVQRFPGARVVSVVPRVLALSGNIPKRYEVREADLVLEGP